MADIGAVTFGGLMTGLDTKTLITQLVSLSRQPIRRLEQNRSQEEQKMSTFKDFNSKILALKSAADKLLNPTSFFARTSNVSDGTAIGVTVSNAAQEGNYIVSIDQLARIGQQTFVGVESKTSKVLSGEFTIENSPNNSSDFTIRINTNGMSLEELREAINSDINNSGKVTATIIDTGSGDERFRLQVKGIKTGATNDFNITSISSLINDNDENVTFSAEDANFSVDGVSITRVNNIISDVIDGVVFTLNKETKESINIKIENDVGYIKSNIKSFIENYNDIRSHVNSNSILDQKNPQNNGYFLGDSTIRGIYMRLQQIMTRNISGSDEIFRSLQDIGIKTGVNGMLMVDENKLSEVISSNTETVGRIFFGEDDNRGIAFKLSSELSKYTNPIGGIINLRVNGIRSRVMGMNDRIEIMERRVSEYEKYLIKKFTAMEQLVGYLQINGNAFSSIKN